MFLNKSKVLNAIEQMEINFEEVAAFDKEIERLHSEQDKYLTLRAGLYEDLKSRLFQRKILRISEKYMSSVIRNFSRLSIIRRKP